MLDEGSKLWQVSPMRLSIWPFEEKPIAMDAVHVAEKHQNKAEKSEKSLSISILLPFIFKFN